MGVLVIYNVRILYIYIGSVSNLQCTYIVYIYGSVSNLQCTYIIYIWEC